MGPELFWILFSIFGRSAFPALFLVICSILKQEAAISSVFAIFFGAQNIHVAWYFATRVHARLVYVCFIPLYMGMGQNSVPQQLDG